MTELNRDEAFALLTEYTKNDSLVKHALGVEAAMRYYAQKTGEDQELFGITGLLHDFDYERWPEAPDHPLQGCAILEEKGYPSEVIEAVKGHADYLGVPRQTALAKTLYAVDELVGLVIAVALVRPSKQLADVKVKSVKKKLKDKGFARGCNREDIQKGIEELGVDQDEHFGNVIDALKGIADELGL